MNKINIQGAQRCAPCMSSAFIPADVCPVVSQKIIDSQYVEII